MGGGPAGSYAASALQREGHEVALLESARFPRYHIGESLLPSMRNYLRFIGLEDEFAEYGFLTKPGVSFKLVHGIPDTWNDFTRLGPGYESWNVIRSEMDHLFLRHAEKQGVRAFQGTRVESIEFEDDPASSRPIAANWANKDGDTGRIAFDWLIDATGRAGIMSTKYLKNREMRESLRNVAVWGYWKGVKRYAAGTKKANSGWFEALTDETGWSWTIPLHDGTTSIGFVMHQTASNAKKSTKPTLTDHYLDQLQFVPGVRELIGEEGSMMSDSIKSAADYSYSATRYAGDHFRIIGDAANFVDPFFSSGVHIAITGGLSAALTICASIKGEASEATAQEWHDSKVGIAHTRFLFVVLGAYQQMHLQTYPILSDINAKNFDDAFKMFHPGSPIFLAKSRFINKDVHAAVIYGLADSSERLTDAKVQYMMDTLQNYFDPYVDEEHVMAVRRRYGTEVISLESPVLGREKIMSLVKDDNDGERVLKKVDATRVFTDEIEVTGMGRHPLLGYVANIEKGQLGLRKFVELLAGREM
ncbi:FAD/NAD(P)-binding domain-containing protein [Mycena sanguinolenta]|uniref:FAD/NAD(P)-binding domain-containing protein n=1 Tax=Mycena sanguinolenta TaxID=230812 RepID=A0A8H6XTV1_9AGAR|nr:FAD/NAD(P)-binding domain-containing protein [Mycena sanguinolenta]